MFEVVFDTASVFFVLPSWNCGHFTAIIRGAFFPFSNLILFRHYSDRIELTSKHNKKYIYSFCYLCRINTHILGMDDRSLGAHSAHTHKIKAVYVFFLSHSKRKGLVLVLFRFVS